MKSTIYALAFAALASTADAQSSITQNFNSGNRNLESSKCWYTPGCSFINSPSSNVLEGTYTAQTGQLSSPTVNGLISPWTKLRGTGAITFMHKLTAWNNGTNRQIYVALESSDNPGAEDTLWRFNYSSATATTTRTESVSIPAYTKDKVYRIRILFWGKGGSARGLLDNVKIDGQYWSDPANNCGALRVIQDADNDGVPDEQDAYPNDRYRAYNIYYPSNGYGTAMFEDLWPSMGDFDFNDLVINGRMKMVTNAANKVVELTYYIVPRAIGGSLRNGFAVQFDGISSSAAYSVTRSRTCGSLFTLAANGGEQGQAKLNIPFFSAANDILVNTTGTSGVNINPNVAFIKPDTLTTTITFMQNGVTANNQPSYTAADMIIAANPYVIINGERGKEVHTINKVASSLASSTYYGTDDDATNPSQNIWFKTKNNLPWAISVPAVIPYSLEGVDITQAYLKLAAWAQSGGTLYTDWYLDKPGYRNNTNLYTK